MDDAQLQRPELPLHAVSPPTVWPAPVWPAPAWPAPQPAFVQVQPVWAPWWQPPPWPPERPPRADKGIPALRYELESPVRRRRIVALARLLLGPLALVAALILRLATALTVPLAWLVVLIAGRLPRTWHAAYWHVLVLVNRARAFGWVATDGPPPLIEPRGPRPPRRVRALAWLAIAPASLLLRYLAGWALALTALASTSCVLFAGRQPRPLQRTLRTLLEYIADGDAYLLLLDDRRARLRDPRPDLAPPPVPVRAPWPAIAWLWTSLLAIGLTIAIAIPIVAVAGIAHGRVGDSPGFNLAAGALQSIVLLGAALIVARLYGRPRAQYLGLDKLLFWRSLGWAGLALLGFAGVFVALLLLAAPTFAATNAQLGPFVHSSVAVLVGAFVAIAVIAPICEEVLFRGVLFGALRRWRGVWPAAAISAFIFSFAHLDFAPVLFVDRLVAGFIWSLVYAKTGRLAPTMMAHAANNAIVLGIQRDWDWWPVALVVAACVSVVAVVVAVVTRVAGRRVVGPEAAAG